MNRSFAIRTVFLALFSSLLAFSAMPPIQAGTTGTMSGLVYDESGAPLAGVSVTVDSPSQKSTATTSAKGNFSFLSLAPDSYTITLKKDGYAPQVATGVSVTSDQSLTLTFNLKKS